MSESVFLVSSAIHAKHGVYDTQTRLEQTIETCKSIRNKCDADIILLDGGYQDITEKERDDILTMYKQLINENKHLQSNFSKLYLDRDQVVEKDTEIDSWKSQCEDLKKQLKQAQLDIGSLRTQLSRATDAARRSGGQCRITDADDMDIKLAELESKNEVLTLEIQELQERLKLENGFDKTCLMEKTIEQQYALIGEMDAEQARLIVENSRLREQVSLVSRIPAA